MPRTTLDLNPTVPMNLRETHWASTGNPAQNYVDFVADTWTEFASFSGRGSVREVPFEYVGDRDLAWIRWKVDGADRYQSGDVGIPLNHFIGAIGTTTRYHCDGWGQTVIDDAGDKFSGVNKIGIPFANGITFEIFTSDPAGATIYSMPVIQKDSRYPFDADPTGDGWRLYAHTIVNAGVDHALLDALGAAVVGFLQEMNYPSGRGTLEANHVLKYGTSLATETQTTGSEDIVRENGWYFVAGVLRFDLAGVIYDNGLTNTGVYVLFGKPEPTTQRWPYNPERVQLSWAALSDASSIATVWFYAKTAPTYNVPSIPQNLAANAGSSEVTVTWDYLAEYGVAGYELYRDGELAYRGTANTFTDTGLDNGTEYTYSLKAFNPFDELSDESDAVDATPVSNAALNFPGTSGNVARVAIEATIAALTGDFRIEALIALDNWAANPSFRSGNGGSIISEGPSGFMGLRIWHDSTNTQLVSALPSGGSAVPNGAYRWVSLRHDRDNGSGNREVKNYMALDDGLGNAGTFTQFGGTGTVAATGATTAPSGNWDIGFAFGGGSAGKCKIYRVYNALTGGTAVINIDFRNHEGQTSFTDSAGRSVSIIGTATITD